MASKRRKTKVNLREFRAWLAGVEELQPESWSPNRDQWKLIRAKIDCIIEEPIEPSAKPAGNQGNNPSPRIPFGPAPVVASSIPQGNVAMSADAKALFEPVRGETTPANIDTSDGKFESSFL